MNGIDGKGHRRLWVHLVWATRERERLLDPSLDDWLGRIIAVRSEQIGCQALAVGNASDHVHVLLGFPATSTIATIAHGLKASSGRALAGRVARFGWQAGYFAESVGDVDALKDFVRRQREHHQDSATPESWEAFFETGG